MPDDPRFTLSNSPMSGLQILVVIITIGLNALDGFDIASISFASPGIAGEWGIDHAALGILLSMELIGMGIGSISLGGLADKIGRRPTILGCLVAMVIGMLMVTTSHGVYDLSLWRIVTGLGIGGMLSAINAVAAEFSNDQRRHFFVSLTVIGYPIGIVIGGSFIRPLLAGYDWRSVFYFGTMATALFIPLVYFFVPESIHWLTQKQSDGALEKINRAMRRFHHNEIEVLPLIHEDDRKRSLGDLFAPGLIGTTLIITVAYFFHITTFYFIIKWSPKIVADMGFAPAAAGSVLTWSNVGGAIGGALFGLMTFRMGLKSLTIAMLALSVIAINAFGRSPQDLTWLCVLATVGGFCTNSTIVGLYAIFAYVFPTHVRAFGTGFAIGIGRGGAAISPIIAGFLLDSGQSLSAVATVMAMGSLLAACAMLFIKLLPSNEIQTMDSNTVVEGNQ